MRNIMAIIFMVLIISSATYAEPELKGSPTELTNYLCDMPESVILSGQSELKVQADSAFVKIGVVTSNSSLQNALKSNQDLRKKIFDILDKSGISSDKITASKFSSTPKYGLFDKKPSSYKVENIVKITIANERGFQEVAKIVDSFEEVYYRGTEFELSNKDEVKQKAIEQACDAVLKKKKIYEDKFGIALIPKSFSEGDVTQVGAEPDEGYSGRLKEEVSNIYYSSRGEAGSSFGEIIFYGHVTADYIVENK